MITPIAAAALLLLPALGLATPITTNTTELVQPAGDANLTAVSTFDKREVAKQGKYKKHGFSDVFDNYACFDKNTVNLHEVDVAMNAMKAWCGDGKTIPPQERVIFYYRGAMVWTLNMAGEQPCRALEIEKFQRVALQECRPGDGVQVDIKQWGKKMGYADLAYMPVEYVKIGHQEWVFDVLESQQSDDGSGDGQDEEGPKQL